MSIKRYGEDFFNDQAQGAYQSAKATLPIVVNLLNPKSVVDLGCGAGTWLKVFQELGVADILGVENEYVKEQKTFVSKDNYLFHDLATELPTDRRFDLAVSLEVGEHLPSKAANVFVKSLCKLSDIVLFSAAIIGQEGTLHINEQFPEYWAKLFKENNYLPIDFIRPKIWNDEKVEVWYRQNILLYVKQDKLFTLPEELRACQRGTYGDYLLKVHPDLYLRILKRKYPFHFANYWWYKLKRSIKKF